MLAGERSIRVIVQEPKLKTVSEGETVKFTCIGISQVSSDVCSHFLLYSHRPPTPLLSVLVSVLCWFCGLGYFYVVILLNLTLDVVFPICVALVGVV